MNNIKIANIGENIAELYLKKHGYQIITRNKRINHAEIDIVACKDNVLRFVEVKTMMAGGKYRPEDQLNRRKLNVLRRAADKYLLILGKNKTVINIEALAIILDYRKRIANIKHFFNII